MSVILPTFEDREKLTAGKLNQLRDAVENKFSAITGADLTWPLVAEGDIDMGSQYSIVGLRTLWNVINAGDYEPNSTGFQAAVNAAIAAGGGCVFVPPNSSIPIDGIDITSGNILILGAGPHSVLKLTTGATSGYMFQSSAGDLPDLAIMNLTLDGQSTGLLQKGVVMQYVDGFTMRDVIIKNFTGDAVEFTSDVAGNSCKRVTMDNIKFDGGGAAHIKADDIDGGFFTNILCENAAVTPINFNATAAGNFIKNLHFDDVRVDGVTTGSGISLAGNGATSANWSKIIVANCQVSSVTAHGIIANNGIQRSSIHNNFIHSLSAPGIGIDISDDTDVTVTGNTLVGNTGTVAIDADGTTGCRVTDNQLLGTWTTTILKTNVTDLKTGNNYGDFGPGRSFIDVTDYSRSGSTGTIAGFSKTITGGTLHIGSVLRVRVGFSIVYDSTNSGALDLEIGGNTIAAVGPFTANTDGVAEWHLVVNGLSTANNIESTLMWIASTAPTTGSDLATDTIDVAVDQDITFKATIPGGTTSVTVKTIEIEIVGGV